MPVEIVTKEDLQILRFQLIEDFKVLVAQSKQQTSEGLEGYKTKHVRKILDCSANKLQSLRILGKLRIKKIGGTIYYNKVDVEKLLKDGF